MRRCIELAGRGAGNVAPNPMVGAVLVYEGRIIGEGFHEKFGETHAEVNCLNSVVPENRALISKSTLYVSLEPCVHFGKTPPCTDLIIKNKIPHVVIGCTDSFEKVTGRGIETLRSAGIKVELNMLQNDCRKINRRFFTFYEKNRPYIILKWAQSSDGKIAGENGAKIKITNEFTDRLVHKWRTEEAAILVGANTVIIDDPSLTARKWPGNNPVRVVIDPDLKISSQKKILDGEALTLILNKNKNETTGRNIFCKMNETGNGTKETLRYLHDRQLNSVIIEGGSKTLQAFTDAGLWDEARVLTNNTMHIKCGTSSPVLKDEKLIRKEDLFTDTISFYKHSGNEFL